MKLHHKLAILLAALVVAVGVAWPQISAYAQNTACYFEQGGAKFVAASGCEIEVQPGATFDLQSGTTIGGDLVVDDTFNIDDTVVAISGSQTVTPTYSMMTVAPTVASTITLATGSAEAGDLLLILNTVTTNTNIVDTGATVGGAGIDLGQNDLALFVFLNSVWVEIASPDNS